MKWRYQHAGHVLGPYTADEMRLLASLELLEPDDPLWPDDGNARDALEARSAIDFASLPKPRLAAPDWLPDVQDAERRGPQPIAWPALGTPDWLADLHKSECGAESHVPPVVAKAAGESLEASATFTSAAAPSEHGGAVPVAKGPQPAGSIEHVFQRAQAAIHTWADMDVNKALILSGDRDALRRDVAIHVILRLVATAGPQVADRLWRHLELVVENRKKYYLAMR